MRRSCVARVEPDAPLPCPSSAGVIVVGGCRQPTHNGSRASALWCVCVWVGTGEDKA